MERPYTDDSTCKTDYKIVQHGNTIKYKERNKHFLKNKGGFL